jgi:tRNA pseudouridine38-40 synthase
MRRLIALAFAHEGPMLAIDFKANAFLQHMVRNLVGALVEIGRGTQAPSWARALMASGDRTLGGVTAPPQGLTLVEVAYPAEFGLPTDGTEP